MKRSTDVAFLNSVLNDPTVFPHVSLGMKPPLDATPLLENQQNIFLANDHGGILLIARPDYVYEVHIQMLPPGRGAAVLAAAREAARYMFTQTDAMRLDAGIPAENVAAERLAVAVGFTKWGVAEFQGIPLNYYVLTLKEWARSLSCQ